VGLLEKSDTLAERGGLFGGAEGTFALKLIVFGSA
jgi:hypothetical protein